MPSASAGLELPATSLMAPLLPAIPLSWSPLVRAPAVRDDPRGEGFSDGITCKKQSPDTSRFGGRETEFGAWPPQVFLPSDPPLPLRQMARFLPIGRRNPWL